MRQYISDLAATALTATLCWVAACQLLDDASSPGRCQTTFIWEAYRPITLSSNVSAQYPSYRLITYVGDNQAAAGAARNRTAVPVLFVHGHMGSHQQMRSLASETAREMLRRAVADPGLGFWLTWHGVDFAEEMSAFSAQLLARQAAFVVACIRHLEAAHLAVSKDGPFHMAVVAYSMGGVVARAALEQLQQDPSFDPATIMLLITLGAPNHHFPSFMPPTAIHAALSAQSLAAFRLQVEHNGSGASAPANQPHSLTSPDTSDTAKQPTGAGGIPPKPPFGPAINPASVGQRQASAAQAASGAADTGIPTLAVTAGPADIMVSELASGAPFGLASAVRPAGGWVQASMQDVPGVWTSTTHKGIVSCNQLVRQLVPLLADVTVISLQADQCSCDGGSSSSNSGSCGRADATQMPSSTPGLNPRTQVANLVRSRMTSSLGPVIAPAVTGPHSKGSMALNNTSNTAVKSASGPDLVDAPRASCPAPTIHFDSLPDMAVEEVPPASRKGPSWVHRRVEPGQSLALVWKPTSLHRLGRAGLLLLVNQARPCEHFSLQATLARSAEGPAQHDTNSRGGGSGGGGWSRQEQLRPAGASQSGGVELAGAAQPLPSLVPGVAELAGGPGRARSWYEITAGIDWLGNATWLAYVPYDSQLVKLELRLAAPSGRPATVLAQHLLFSSGPAHLPGPRGSPEHIPANSPALTFYRAPAGWLAAGSDGSTCKNSSRVTGGSTALASSLAAQAAQVIFGSVLPWRIRVAPLPSCPSQEGVKSSNSSTSRSSSRGQTRQGCLLPAVIALGLEPGEQLRSFRADVVRVGTAGVPLWRGDVAGRSLAVLTDPRCCHTLSVEWDMLAWLGVSLRHHAYSLPSLCTALAMTALVDQQVKGSRGRPASVAPSTPLAAAAVIVAAWGSQHPQQAQQATGLLPWASLSAAEGAALLFVARGLLALVQLFLRASVLLASRLAATLPLPRPPLLNSNRGENGMGRAPLHLLVSPGGSVAITVAAAAVHPALALLAGLLRMWLASVAASSSLCSKSPGSRQACGEGVYSTSEGSRCREEVDEVDPGINCDKPAGDTHHRAPQRGQHGLTTLPRRWSLEQHTKQVAGGSSPTAERVPSARPAANGVPAAALTTDVAPPEPGSSSTPCSGPLAHSCCGSGRPVGSPEPEEGGAVSHQPQLGWLWLTLYTLVAVLAAPGLAAWLHSRHTVRPPVGLWGAWLTGWAPLAIMGIHAASCCCRAAGSSSPNKVGHTRVQPAVWSVPPVLLVVLRAATPAAGACAALVTAVAGLWGYPCVALYACGSLAMLAVCETALASLVD